MRWVLSYWLIELCFRELKSHYELEALPSTKPHIVEALLFAAFITMVVSQSWLRLLRKAAGPLAERCRTERWAAIFRTVAVDLLAIILYTAEEAEAIVRPGRCLALRTGDSVDIALPPILIREKGPKRASL